jgi:hypothetical protein
VGERIAIHAKQAVEDQTVSKHPSCMNGNATSVTLTRLATPAYMKETMEETRKEERRSLH